MSEVSRPKPELLAPAGGWPQLRAAIAFGADAVYLATERFGMRARAVNFALEELPAVVAEAHASGVKVHVTCNILMHDDDIADLPSYFEALQAAGVDAVIVSDMGAAAVARSHAPNVALHVSTQASVANAAAAEAWGSLGASRIVLAREVSLAEIAAMRAALDADGFENLELEAFVHGAMCMAVSGRCLISAYLTGRSGNRGHCTQPCRWSYDLAMADTEEAFFALREEKRPDLLFPIEQDAAGSYIMNAKDLCMLAHLDELRAAGVSSVKIEGRNKKALYVATVVNAYRHVLDGEAAEVWLPELDNVSHRLYSTGFYFGMAEQAPDYEGYSQECLHVADVVACEAAAEGGYEVALRCHNRFAEGEQLEVLAPHSPVTVTAIERLRWLPAPDEDGAQPPAEQVAVANRATSYDTYLARVAAPIPAGSLLRRREFRRTSRVIPAE